MKQKDSHGLPPCSLSAHCLRLVDDLDPSDMAQQREEVSFARDIQDERLLDQLRFHVPNCPTCSVVVAHARRVRAEQRFALRELLLENEARVPSTIPRIFAAIQQQNDVAPSTNKRMRYYLQELVVSPETQKLNGNGNGNHNHHHAVEPAGHSGHVLRNALSLATVAALVLAAVALFSHTNSHQTSHPASVHVSKAPTPIDNHGWNTFVVGLTVLSASAGIAKTTIYNYNSSSKREPLAPSFSADAVQLDSIPQEGSSLLYHYLSGGQMQYTTLQPLPNTGFFYQQNGTDGNAGNAVWMDDTHAFVAGGENGVVEVDTQNGKMIRRFPMTRTVRLSFYHTPYLYFVSGLPSQQGVSPALYRVNANVDNDQPRKISMRSPNTTFWFSPDGTTIYYLNKGPDGERAIYAVDVDGNHSRPLHVGDATPIGYDENSDVIFMQQVNHKFQVVQLGATPQQKEKVVMLDAAPEATSLCDPGVNPASGSICDSNIALAPYGHELILDAYYPGGTHQVLYDDLTTGKSIPLIPSLDSNTKVQLPGWDKMPVLPTATTSAHDITSTLRTSATSSSNRLQNAALRGDSYRRIRPLLLAC